MGEGKEEIRQWHTEAAEKALGESQAAASTKDSQQMIKIQRKGAWLSVLPSTVNVTELGAQKWRDSIFLRYGINPPDLPDDYDGCGAEFSICHDLDCKKVGLITAHHNDLCDGVANLVGKAFTPAHVHDEPKMFTDRAVHGEKSKDNVKRETLKDAGALK